MKGLFELIAALALAVMLAVSTVGCDSCEQSAPPPERPGQPGQPGQPPGYPQQGQQGSTGLKQPQISDADLEKVAAANVAIDEINQEFQQSVQQTQGAEERQRLEVGANQRILQAIANAGLDVQTYNFITEQVRKDQELSRKLMEFEEKAKSSQ